MEIKIHHQRPIPKKRTGNSWWSRMLPTKVDYVAACISLKPGQSIDVPFDAHCLRQHFYDHPGVFVIRQIKVNKWGVWRKN